VSSPIFRPSTAADEAEIASLLRESLGLTAAHPMAKSSHLHWKYWEPHPGWSGSRSFVCVRDGAIVAHGAVIPSICLWQGRRITALHVIDWAAKARFPGTGVALMKQMAKSTDVVFAVGGSDVTQEMLPVVGFKRSATIVTRYARPLRPLLRLVNADYTDWRLAPQVMRAAFWSLTARARGNIEWSARRVLADQLEAEPVIWPSPTSATTVFERSNAWMRYLLDCPATPMELYSVHHNGRPRGYFLLALAPAQARIADCWIDSDDLGDWIATVQLAVRQAMADAHVAEVVSASSDPLLGAALLEGGFHMRYSSPLWLATGRDVAPFDARIRFVMADSDAAFLHDERTTLWA
jgi:hypothetical protein